MWNPSDGDGYSGWPSQATAAENGYPPAPVESGAYRVAGEGYAPASPLLFPLVLLECFDARFTDIYGTRGVEIYVSLIRDGRANSLVQDPRVLSTVANGSMQLGIRAERPGRWQAYFADSHTVAELGREDTAFFDLGTDRSAGSLWFFPDQRGSLLVWLYVYGDAGLWLPLDPHGAFHHRVDSNGALRCMVFD